MWHWLPIGLRPPRTGALQRRRPDDAARKPSNRSHAALAERLLRDMFDVGLVLGHSVRTSRQALTLAGQDAPIFTSLTESRYLAGSRELIDGLLDRLRQTAMRRTKRWCRPSKNRGAASGAIRRDGLLAGTQHQTVSRRIARCAVDAVDRLLLVTARPIRTSSAGRRIRKTTNMLPSATPVEFLLRTAQRTAFPRRQARDQLNRAEQAPPGRTIWLRGSARNAAGRKVHAANIFARPVPSVTSPPVPG